MVIGCVASGTVVPVGDGKNITLSAAEWRPMPNESEYARNFEAVKNSPPRAYHVLTIFLNVMSEDRHSGKKISVREYLEIFASNPGEVTVLLRRDQGTFWLLSREMFRDLVVPGVSLSRVGSFSPNDQQQVWNTLQDRVDRTRHILSRLEAE